MYSWKEYWDTVARSYGWADWRGFAPVLHPGAPDWFNSTIDRLQEKSWRRGLSRCHLSNSSCVLDIGCGTGRWLRRYQQMQIRVVGLDATQDMLRRAIVNGLTSPVVAGRAQELPFRDAAFDLVSDVTVVQHISSSEQGGVLKEMSRVLRPGGYLLLIELIEGEAPHIFSRSPQDWMETAAEAGLTFVFWEGQEFLLLDQIFVNALRVMRRLAGLTHGPTLPGQADASRGKSRSKSSGRVLYWALRRILCKVSEWLEPLIRSTCPGAWATHGTFVFQRHGDD